MTTPHHTPQGSHAALALLVPADVLADFHRGDLTTADIYAGAAVAASRLGLDLHIEDGIAYVNRGSRTDRYRVRIEGEA